MNMRFFSYLFKSMRSNKCLSRCFCVLPFLVGFAFVRNAEAQASYCMSVFESARVGQKFNYFLGAGHIEIPILQRQDFENIEHWDSVAQDRSGGSENLLKAKYKGQLVVLKEFYNPLEIRLVKIFSDLRWGIPLIGRAEFCNCYVMPYIPKAMFVGYRMIDHRSQSFAAQGLFITDQMKKRIQVVTETMALLGIAPGDLQFLATKNNEIFIMDPEFFTQNVAKANSPDTLPNETHQQYSQRVLLKIMTRVESYNQVVKSIIEFPPH